MKHNEITILPLMGFGKLQFGMTLEQITLELGEADELEQLEEPDFESLVLNYHLGQFSLFFEGMGMSNLAYVETQNKEAMLFDAEVFKLNKKEITTLMAKNGFTKTDSEKEEGEERLTFEEAMLDFFFEKEKLIAVSWGVLLNDEGEIEQL